MRKKAIQEDGSTVYEHEDGSYIIRGSDGKIKGGSLTPERAQTLVAQRWQESREAAIKGMVEGVLLALEETGKAPAGLASGSEAWGEVVKAVSYRLMKDAYEKGSNNLRALPEAGRFIAQSTGLAIEPEAESGASNESLITLLGAEMVKTIIQRAQDSRRGYSE